MLIYKALIRPCLSMSFFVTNIIVVYPEIIKCNGIDVDRQQCTNLTKTGHCADLSFEFERNWTTETLIIRWKIKYST